MADTAAELARDYGLELNVLERADCEARGMGAFLAVSQGSDLDPKFLHLVYRPQGEVKRRLALVGKGLTFDSGGYNLKVGAAQIDMMKFDMGGSAAVLGAMRSIAERRPQGVEVHMIVAACENMVNGSAVHPGDIVTAANGTTIEINNTDAEGRLTLADALLYACEQKPDAVVDLATLTGACVIALGDEMAGLWSNDDALAEALDAAAGAAGEGIWRMPLRKSYKDGLKSLLADFEEHGPRPGIDHAALFLQDFVGDGIAWAHIDIAGTVWSDKGRIESGGSHRLRRAHLGQLGLPAGRLIDEQLPGPLVHEGPDGGAAAAVGLCLFGEAVSRGWCSCSGRTAGEWFWTGALSLICINAGIGLMIDSGMTKGFPGRQRSS